MHRRSCAEFSLFRFWFEDIGAVVCVAALLQFVVSSNALLCLNKPYYALVMPSECLINIQVI